MYVEEADNQARSMNELCNEIMKAMEEVKESIDYFMGASLLQGNTYHSAKMFMSMTYRPLAQGTIYLCEELMRQNSKYPSDFKVEVSSTDVIEQEVIEQIERIDSQIEQYKSLEEASMVKMFPVFGLQLMRDALHQKLKNLDTYNTSSSNNYELALEYTSSLLTGLMEIQNNSQFNKVSGTFDFSDINVDFIAKIENTHYKKRAYDEYSEYLEEHPKKVDEVIEALKYEDEHPEDAKNVDEFLEELDEKDQQEIKVILYNSEEPYRTLATQYIDRLELELVEIDEDADDDDIPPSSFSHKENKVSYVYEKDRKNSRGAYYSFFHELGHAIDYNYGQDEQDKKSMYDFSKKSGTNAFYSEYYEVDGETLAEKIHNDFDKKVNEAITDELNSDYYNELFTDAQKEEVQKNIMINIKDRDKYFDYLSPDEQMIQVAVEDSFADELRASHHSMASDAYGGVSDKVISGRFGHDDDYWYNMFGFRKREPNREAFAEYYARQVMYSKDDNDLGIQSAHTYLPESKEMMDDMLASMKKE